MISTVAEINNLKAKLNRWKNMFIFKFFGKY